MKRSGDLSLKWPLALHVGLQKTATTTLQEEVFAKHPGVNIIKRAKSFALDDPRKAGLRPLSDWIDHATPEIPISDQCRNALTAFDVLPPNDRVTVWSNENISFRIPSAQRPANLSRLFGRFKIILVLRNPFDFVESMYFQTLRIENFGPAEGRWLDGPGVFFTIEEWLQDNLTRPRFGRMHGLLYQEALTPYVCECGTDSVLVLLYEQLRDDAVAFFEQLCAFISLDFDVTFRLWNNAEHRNGRMGQAQVDLLKKVASNRQLRDQFCRCSIEERFEMLDWNPVGPSPLDKARVVIPRHLRRRILEINRLSQIWVQEHWNVDLVGQGYRDY